MKYLAILLAALTMGGCVTVNYNEGDAAPPVQEPLASVQGVQAPKGSAVQVQIAHGASVTGSIGPVPVAAPVQDEVADEPEVQSEPAPEPETMAPEVQTPEPTIAERLMAVPDDAWLDLVDAWQLLDEANQRQFLDRVCYPPK